MSDQFDELLDKVLREESAVEPRTGLEQRVMARVGEASAAAPRWWMFAAWVGGLAAVAVVLVVLMPGRPKARAVGHDGLAAGIGGESPSGAKAPSRLMMYGTAEAMPLSKTGTRTEGGRAVREAHLSDDKTVAKMGHPIVVAQEERRLPKLDVFPSPAPADVFPSPVGASEKQDAVAELSSPKAAEALLALRKEQDEPVQVAAIQIVPLEADVDAGRNQ